MDVEQVIRAVFKADAGGLDSALSSLEIKASALDTKIAQINSRPIGQKFLTGDSTNDIAAQLEREVAAQRAAGASKKGMTLEESSLRVMAAQNEALAAAEALAEFDQLDEAIVTASSRSHVLRREFDAFAKSAQQNVFRVKSTLFQLIDIFLLVGGAIGGIITGLVELNEEAHRLTFAQTVKDLQALVNLAGSLGMSMARAASAAERFRDALRDAKVRNLGAQASAARDEGRFAEAGVFDMQKAIMEGQNEAADLRKKAAEAGKEAIALSNTQAIATANLAATDARIADIQRANELDRMSATTAIDDAAQRQALRQEREDIQKRLGPSFNSFTADTQLQGQQAARVQFIHDLALANKKDPRDLLRAIDGLNEAADSVEVAGFSAGKAALAKGFIESVKPKDINVNVANAKFTINQRVTTNDPGELAGAALVSSFRSLTNRVIRPEGMTAPTGRAR